MITLMFHKRFASFQSFFSLLILMDWIYDEVLLYQCSGRSGRDREFLESREQQKRLPALDYPQEFAYPYPIKFRHFSSLKPNTKASEVPGFMAFQRISSMPNPSMLFWCCWAFFFSSRTRKHSWKKSFKLPATSECKKITQTVKCYEIREQSPVKKKKN